MEGKEGLIGNENDEEDEQEEGWERLMASE